MNKFLITILAILGGIEVVFYILTPVLLSIVWISLVSLSQFNVYFFFSMGLLATVFRSIKIGFLKK